MNIYVLRHGQTNWNAKQVVQGKMNESHLDETGIKQATAIREKLLNNVFDTVLVSPLHRAQETAKIVNNGIRKYDIDERLTERSYGDFEGHNYDIYPNYDDLWDYNIVDTSKIGNIEPVKVFFDRIHDVINELKTKYPDGDVLLICHGGVCRAIHYLNEGFDNETDLLQFHANNCQLDIYEF